MKSILPQAWSPGLRNAYFRSLIAYWLTVGLISLVVVFGFLVAADLNWQFGNPILAGVSFGLFLFLIQGFVRGVVAEFHPSSVRIIPFFSGRIPEADTFLKGRGLACHSRRLDQVAERLNLTPLSSFGFRDEYLWRRPQWHSASDGIKTFQGLLDSVRNLPDQSEDQAEMLADLGRVLKTLETAEARNVKFCLIPRLGRMVSPVEISQKRGFFGDEWKEWERPRPKPAVQKLPE
jgi:hypothetical protein